MVFREGGAKISLALPLGWLTLSWDRRRRVGGHERLVEKRMTSVISHPPSPTPRVRVFCGGGLNRFAERQTGSNRGWGHLGSSGWVTVAELSSFFYPAPLPSRFRLEWKVGGESPLPSLWSPEPMTGVRVVCLLFRSLNPEART